MRYKTELIDNVFTHNYADYVGGGTNFKCAQNVHLQDLTIDDNIGNVGASIHIEKIISCNNG